MKKKTNKNTIIAPIYVLLHNMKAGFFFLKNSNTLLYTKRLIKPHNRNTFLKAHNIFLLSNNFPICIVPRKRPEMHFNSLTLSPCIHILYVHIYRRINKYIYAIGPCATWVWTVRSMYTVFFQYLYCFWSLGWESEDAEG